MIKVSIFDGANDPITFISEATVEDFFNWSCESKVVALLEKDSNTVYTIPHLKYPLRIEEIADK